MPTAATTHTRLRRPARGFLLLFISVSIQYTSFAQCEYRRTLWEMENQFLPENASLSAGGDLLVCGTDNSGSGTIVRFNGVNSIRWAKKYSSGALSFHRVIALSNGDIAIGGNEFIDGIIEPVLLRLDADGNIIWQKRYHDEAAPASLSILALTIFDITETDGGGIAAAGRKIFERADNTQATHSFLLSVNADGTERWSGEYTESDNDELNAMLFDAGSIVVAGTTISPSDNIQRAYLQKLDASTGAPLLLRLYQLGNTTVTNFRSIEKSATGYELGSQSITPSLRIYNRVRLASDGSVTELKMLPEFGPDQYDQFFYPIPAADGGSLLWMKDYPTAQDISISRVGAANNMLWNNRFPLPEQQRIIQLMATPENGAIAVATSPDFVTGSFSQDLLVMQVKPDGTTNNCDITPLALAFSDSLNLDVSPGTFISNPLLVTVTDLNISTTTIGTSAPKIPCENNCHPGAIRIEGKTGIICKPGETMQYIFHNEGHCRLPVRWELDNDIADINTVNDSTVNLLFHTTGTATLRATVVNGCDEYSTGYVIAYLPDAVTLDLGPDRSFCSGNSTTISAPAGFSTITWNTGATTPSIEVSAAGLYHVIATTDGTCYQQDSILIRELKSPVVNLPDRDYICTPGYTELIATPGMKSYLWQDGSPNPSITIGTTGDYHVRVTDYNDCTASDTMHITRLQPRPQNFEAFTDTAICYGETITLRVNGGYRSYNWSNGLGSGPSFDIKQPGTYTITVSDSHGCEGSGSITVTNKQCTQEIHMPTAFSPNNDGINELFKANPTAPLSSFELRIFNRWGQTVFSSKNPSAGWNGLLNGQPQPSDIYTWMIHYRFYGSEQIMIKKGTVLLVR